MGFLLNQVSDESHFPRSGGYIVTVWVILRVRLAPTGFALQVIVLVLIVSVLFVSAEVLVFGYGFQFHTLLLCLSKSKKYRGIFYVVRRVTLF